MQMQYHEDPVIWNVNKQCQRMEKNDVVRIQRLILTQPREWRQEQLDDDDIGPILRAKEQDTRPGWADISDQSRELKILWAQGIPYASTKEFCTVYGNLKMVKTSTYKLWCQDLAFLKCYAAFMIVFLVDILE